MSAPGKLFLLEGSYLRAEPAPREFNHPSFNPSDLSGWARSGGSRSVGSNVGTSIDSRPGWFNQCFEHKCGKVAPDLPETDSGKTNVERFQIERRLLFCQLGDCVLAKFPLRVARLLGNIPQLPDDESVYNQMFEHLLKGKFDAVHLDSVNPHTLLWNYLQSSPLIQESFHFYSQQGPLPHWLIRLDGSFTDYMNRFSPKTRKNRFREIKILRKLGDVKLIRVTDAPAIDDFLSVAYNISQKTLQFKRFGWSIAARDPCLLKNEMLRLAQQGWLRSYLLTCGNVPCSFILGEQSGSRFHPVAAGVDPAWRDYSAGTVLLLFVLEDLFKENPPEFYDLGACAKDKEHLATHSYLEASVWLFRRRPYAALASNAYRTCSLISKVGGAALQRLGLKGKAKRLMRRIDLVIARGQ